MSDLKLQPSDSKLRIDVPKLQVDELKLEMDDPKPEINAPKLHIDDSKLETRPSKLRAGESKLEVGGSKLGMRRSKREAEAPSLEIRGSRLGGGDRTLSLVYHTCRAHSRHSRCLQGGSHDDRRLEGGGGRAQKHTGIVVLLGNGGVWCS